VVLCGCVQERRSSNTSVLPSTNGSLQTSQSSLRDQSDPPEPDWVTSVRSISVGMTRSEAEALLPNEAFLGGDSYHSGGSDRQCYAFAGGWNVRITYSVPMKVKDGVQGWFYDRDPNETVFAPPVIERPKDSKRVDTYPSKPRFAWLTWSGHSRRWRRQGREGV